MSRLRVLGVMTGTSCDGLDAACLEFSHKGWKALWSQSVSYDPGLRARILALQKPGTKTDLRGLLATNRDLGIWYASTLSKVLKKHRGHSPDAIAVHGQTVAHFPASKGRGTTLQLGDPALIAFKTGLTVASDFRRGDIAAGGQGAPLLPRFHALLAESLASDPTGIAIQNIGGISNISYFGPRGKVIAFDTGPGNIWIDAAAESVSHGRLSMDRDGKMSARGNPDWAAVQKILKHSYFKLEPPKSTGRDDFPFRDFKNKTRARGDDLVATAAAVTAASSRQAYERWITRQRLPLKAIYVCGGGAHNPSLLALMRSLMPGVRILSIAQAGLDPGLIEAQGFAYFGCLALLGHPVGGPWTGADGFSPPASISPGRNWLALLKKIEGLRGG